MAIRYSGDTEIRVGWDPRRKEYRGSIRDPKRPKRNMKARFKPLLVSRNPRSPEAYDIAAVQMLQDADRHTTGGLEVERRNGRIKIRRVFQAPCPVGTTW